MTMTTRPDDHGVSRRTVARTAAWATPVVLTAVAAPAYAAISSGGCSDRGSDPMNQGLGSAVVFLAFFDPSGKATGLQADIAITATDKAGNALPAGRRASDTGTVGKTDYTPSWNYINLHHPKGMQEGDTLTLALSFSRVVSNFQLTMTDIDKVTGQWVDQVFVSPSGYGVAAKGPNVTGSGVTGDPFTTQVEAEIHTNAGDLTLTWPGQVTGVQISYRVGDTKNTSSLGQHIGIGGFSYNNCA